MFSQAWLQSLVPANLISGFKTCGIYPLNRNAVKPVGDINGKCSANKQHKTTEGSDANEGCSATKEPRDESGYSKLSVLNKKNYSRKDLKKGMIYVLIQNTMRGSRSIIQNHWWIQHLVPDLL